jgi:hypothetical protein
MLHRLDLIAEPPGMEIPGVLLGNAAGDGGQPLVLLRLRGLHLDFVLQFLGGRHGNRLFQRVREVTNSSYAL